jgi:hypothetical protein
MEASHARSDSRVVSASARSPSRPFNLTRRASLLALACIASLSMALAVLLSNFLTDKMLHREATATMEFVQDEV